VGDRDQLRVATWNIWWRHGDLPAREPAILATMRELDADIIGLQEVCSREPDQVGWLTEELGLHVVAAPGGDDDRFTIVNVVASRWPIIESEWRYLDVGDMPPHRTVLRARVDTPAGPVDLYSTHLSHGFDQSALRQRQVAEIASLVDERRAPDGAGLPPILVGDLNAVPDSDEIRALTGLAPPPVPGLVFTDTWAQVGPDDGVTYSDANPYVVDSAWPERRLDYVLVSWPRPRPRGNPVRAWRFGIDPVDDVVASDHFGVAVDLHW
jgi:endonuclease/exonuclease/phosphatase family metal-dependent hydrolase